LALVTEMQRGGELPAELVWKVSVLMAPSNPLALRELERLGASTANIPSDVSVEQLGELRAATALPLDLYVESPDGLGGIVRGDELGDRGPAGAPLSAKFGLGTPRRTYPSAANPAARPPPMAGETVPRAAPPPE